MQTGICTATQNKKNLPYELYMCFGKIVFLNHFAMPIREGNGDMFAIAIQPG